MSKPKILFYDIETFPNIGYTWGKWEQNVIKFIRPWELASFAYRWLGEKKTRCFSRRNLSEKQVAKRLRDILSKADIIVAHNGDAFDIKKARTRFLKLGIDPPAINRSVDTKKVAKSQFGFNSNSLNDLAEFFDLGGKTPTGGFDLWLGCMDGKSSSWDLMEKYNKQDVVLLEKIYSKFRSWMPNHPSVAAFLGRPGCPMCGSSRSQSRGVQGAKTRLYKRYQCLDCRGWFKGAVSK